MPISQSTLNTLRLAMAIGTVLSAGSALAQDVDHSTMDHSAMHHPAPQEPAGAGPETSQETAAPSLRAGEAKDQATHVHADATLHPVANDATGAEAVDHSKMDHSVPGSGPDAGETAEDPPAASTHVDHSTMDHSKIDHSSMDHAEPADSSMEHSRHGVGHGSPGAPSTLPLEPIPTLTDADRRAAFPDLAPHPAHGDSVHSYFLANRLEAWDADHGTGMAWEAQAWIGKDTERVWIRSEGERSGGQTEAADIEFLYGRSVSPWWDVVAGVRHDFKPGDAQSHLAIGVMGLAPQWFEIEATAYLSEHGRVSARIEAEYELLLTNRLVLQPLVEASFQGGSDPRRGTGSGLGTVESGLRLRYEVTRHFAPYIGVVHERAFGGTADFRREAGEATDDTHVVAGLRIWF